MNEVDETDAEGLAELVEKLKVNGAVVMQNFMAAKNSSSSKAKRKKN